MKFNKKITVTALSTVLGLGLVGSISGAVAWYQYSTRATTSIVGISGAKSGALEVSLARDSGWVRDLKTSDLTSTASAGEANPFDHFLPVTFGGFDGTNVATNLPGTAYKNPDVGNATMSNWKTATVNEDYVQYVVYLRARQLNESTNAYDNVAESVYFSDITIADLSGQATGLSIEDALRVHVAFDTVKVSDDSVVTAGNRYLLSKAGGSLNTYGELDLDGINGSDTYGGYEWADNYGTTVIYGDKTAEEGSGVQKSVQASTLVAARDAQGELTGSPVATTVAGSDNVLRATVTIWTEGWAQLDPVADPSNVKAMWNTEKRNNVVFHVGLTFDVGYSAFQDANPAA